MKGIDVIAEAILACTDRQYTVPGFPITDLGARVHAEMVINEKTALEYALGDSLQGRRAAVIVKNVGVNACADPLLQATAQGLIGGVVLVAGDDPDAQGSQTAQDSRYYGELAELPVIEPGTATCSLGVEAALEASEHFSRVAMLRLTPTLLEADVENIPVQRKDGKGRLSERTWTMNGRVTAAEELYRTMFAWSSASPLNRWDGEPAGAGPLPGKTRIVTVNPLPKQAAAIQEVREYGRTFIRDHRGVQPPVPQKRPQCLEDRGHYKTFCSNCPFKGMMDILKARNTAMICDAGCSVLGMTPPYELGVASYGMGASIAVAARSTKVALIGDYALLHSGLNALIDVYEKRLPILCIVMNNECTAMTGKQPAYNPLPYLQWADPVICRAEDLSELERELVVTDRPRTLVISGTCPEGCSHELVEY
ncbi:thiamine pyrophosphate-dependent enzyme [Methanoregula sp.]|uniref:thiamine pyrophosphate-dependent enzyme n=1 Tax=Methanoregula sp. TaxID=2052170 RepID=UPI0023737D60|nr:thiamine pyrophosphate-dependent enzyme [Methanoregula sp.]MDD1686671.1 thiamine pyrophosphate-dependent enzyme [Methanoregula sp.]